MHIFPFSHDTLMLLTIVLASVHIILSGIMLVLVIRKVQLPPYVLPGFLVVSILACLLILLYAIDCKSMDYKSM
jgi:hypothetical protein